MREGQEVLTKFPLDAEAVTLDTDFESESTIYVGAAGNVNVRTWRGTDVVFVGMQASQVVPVRVKRVHTTSTTASSLVRIF